MIYETERLFTRQMDMSDMPALKDILQNREVMYAYEHAFSDEEALAWMERQLARYREHGFGLWALVLKESGRMIGQCGLTMQQAGARQVLEIGYHLQRAHWHKGYAIEAAMGCKRYAFETLGAEEVFSIIRDTNIASMNVAIRNGMVIEGRFIKHYYGIDMPHYLFSVKKMKPCLLTLADVDAVTACYNAANGLFAPDRRPTATRDDFLDLMRHDTMLGWRQDGLAGFASYRVQNKVAFINSLYVDISAGRRGIGTALMNAATQRAQAQGAALCIVDCLKNAPWALAFYRKLGFEPYQADSCPVDDPDALAYFKAQESHTWSVQLFKSI